MRERARELGGELRMLSANPGTTVEVVIPSVVPVPAATATA
jgi:signal transduction histidine kinase